MSIAAKIHGSLLAQCAALFLLAACGDDEEKSPSKDAGTQSRNDAGQTTPDAGNTGERDAGDQEPTKDAGGDDEDAGDLDADVEDGSTPVDGDASITTPLPADGQRLSVCYTDEDCTGDGATCYIGAGTLPGFCTSTCTEDADCEPLAGIASSCSSDGQCRVDCGGTPDADAGTDAGSGNGACPPSMECRDTNVLIFAPPAFRCSYLEGAGSKASNEYGSCNTAHENGDCAGALACHVPSSGVVVNGGPGYCASACEEDAQCTSTGGSSAAPVCSTGGNCELDCAGSGTTCPAGMNCRDIDETPIFEVYRCRFIAAP